MPAGWMMRYERKKTVVKKYNKYYKNGISRSKPCVPIPKASDFNSIKHWIYKRNLGLALNTIAYLKASYRDYETTIIVEM